MSPKSTPKPKDDEQSKRFIEAAKQSGADETEAGAERAFKKVATPKRPSGKTRTS